MNTVKERLEAAYDIVAKIPAERFTANLGSYYGHGRLDPRSEYRNECETLACAAGWLALDEQFKPYVNMSDYGSLSFNRLFTKPGEDEKVVHRLLFGHRRALLSFFDCEPRCEELSDKQLALYRIRRRMGELPDEAFMKVETLDQQIA